MRTGELVLWHLADSLEEAMGERLLGLYVHGSFAAPPGSGYSDAHSDLDVLAVLARPVTEDDLPVLEAVHDDVLESYPAWRHRLEVAYVDADSMRRITRERVRLARISPGEDLNLRWSAPHWLLDWYGLQEQGEVLRGDPVDAHLPHISREEFVASARDTLVSWREWLPEFATATGKSYAVLSICRLLCAATTGDLVSKTEAALRVRTAHPRWERLTTAAQIHRFDPDTSGSAWGEEDLDERGDLLEFAIDLTSAPGHQASSQN